MSDESYVKLSEVERAYVAGFMSAIQNEPAVDADEEEVAAHRAAYFLARSGLGVEGIEVVCDTGAAEDLADDLGAWVEKRRAGDVIDADSERPAILLLPPTTPPRPPR